MSIKMDQGTLRAALVGYQQQLSQIESKMAELRRQLGGSAPKAAPSTAKASAPRKHRMSAAGRARIAAAQRARWAKVHKAQKAAA
jgi:peptidoglycan hydrolase CwlO-like protein